MECSGVLHGHTKILHTTQCEFSRVSSLERLLALERISHYVGPEGQLAYVSS